MPSRGKLVFVTGAARSGKSFFAEKMAATLGGKVTYIATCVPGDDEMRDRVARHQARRPPNWQTIEEDLNPSRVIKAFDEPGRIFLLDCLTLLISNLILQPDIEPGEEEILQRITELAQVSYESKAHVIIVSNEVGWGIVPGDSLSRLYRDIIGRANQKIVSCADEAYLTIAGIPIELKTLSREIAAGTPMTEN
ncbi:MAG: bifunctional adenosylcobinamide kinase/adenosylcobinamide-phosphate guanylyltransferase [Syntrophomonadaceae bacterium]|nr:bifunctional adenosylcobinamide kinase/adenosylcobinamide-phosphate guanylyltransferase [Syntrophomonadaceae bacterium]